MATTTIHLAHRDGQGYSLNKGKYKNDQGDVKYRRWWLGHDAGDAQRIARLIVAEYSVLKAKGIDIWPPEVIRRLEAEKQGIASVVAEVAARPVEQASPLAGAGLTWYEAFQKWLDFREAEARNNQIGGSQFKQDQYCIGRIKAVMPDGALAQTTREAIRKVVDHFLARPISDRTNRPLAPETVIATLGCFKRCCKWLNEEELLSDDLHYDRALKFKRDKLWTDAEREEQSTVKTFTVDELRTIWAATSRRRQMALILGALNLAHTQIELATLGKKQVRLNAVSSKGQPRPHVDRIRRKTKIRSRWRLWEETALVFALEEAKTGDLFFLNEDGKPLVYLTTVTLPDGKPKINICDSVRCVWNRLLEDANELAKQSPDKFVPVRKLGFKYLRKTAANIVRKIGGKDAAECFLAHRDATEAKKYTNRDYARLAKVLRRARKRLEPMFNGETIEQTLLRVQPVGRGGRRKAA